MRRLLQAPFEYECSDWGFTFLGFPYEEKKELFMWRLRSSARWCDRPSIYGIVSLIKSLNAFLLLYRTYILFVWNVSETKFRDKGTC